jgi:RNase P subunit RPR2
MLIYTKDTKRVGYVYKGEAYLLGSKDEITEETVVLDVEKYGDKFSEKICNICHTIKSVDEFQVNQNAKNNRKVRRPSCNSCRQNIDGKAMQDRTEWDSRKPHLVPFECPVCLKITIPGLTSKVVLHHDHQTGRIIGWICDSCNTGLGRFRDDPEVLLHAIWYLKNH